MVCSKPEVYALDHEIAPDHQAAGHEKDDGNRDFDDDQGAAGEGAGTGGTAAALFERESRIGARRLQRRDEPERDAGAEGDGSGEQEHAPVNHDRLKSGEISGRGGEQRAQAEPSDQRSGRAAEHRDQQAFGEQLPHQATAPCADRGAQRHLALAGGTARDQQVRHIGAGNQEHTGDGAQQDGLPDAPVPTRCSR